MMNQFNSLRTAVITGSTSGIGLELTRKLLVEQWQIIGLNRSAFPADDHVIQSALSSGQLHTVQADLTNYKAFVSPWNRSDHIQILLISCSTMRAEAHLPFNIPLRVVSFISSFRQWFLISFTRNFIS